MTAYRRRFSYLDRVRFRHVFNKLSVPKHIRICVCVRAYVRFEVYGLGHVRLYVREVGDV